MLSTFLPPSIFSHPKLHPRSSMVSPHRITDADFDDQGMYTCVAMNHIDSDSESVRVNVRGRAPGDVRIIGDSEFRSGDEVRLECRVIGQPQPAPTITWNRNGQQLLTDSTLRWESCDTLKPMLLHSM